MKTQSNNAYLLLFEFCRVVEGVERSIICDFQKEKVKFIPNEMVAVIELLKTQPFQQVKNYFHDDADIFNSYIEFMLNEGFAFFTSEKDLFKPMESYWASPETINNALIEYDFKQYDLFKVLRSLDDLGTKFIEFRLTNYSTDNLQELIDIATFCENSVLRSIRFLIPHTSNENCRKITEELSKFALLECVVFYACKTNKILNNNNQQTIFTTQSLENITHSNIDRKYLINSLTHYFECQKYNPYYNKKVAITKNGDIKNCIKNKAVFGNIEKTTIESIVTKESFQEFWTASHDKIVGIKDSELRYNYIITNDLERTENGNFKIIV